MLIGPDICGSDDNLALMIDDVRYDLPPGNADWIDVIQDKRGRFKLRDQDPEAEDVIYTIRVDNIPGYPRELRNFNVCGNLTLNYTGNIQTTYGGSQPTPVPIDFAGLIPCRAKGVHIIFESDIVTPNTGVVVVRLSPDDTHFTVVEAATKQSATTLKVWFTCDVFFRRQRGQTILYHNVNSGGAVLAQSMTPPKIRIQGWWM